MLWHGYFAVERITANLIEDNWIALQYEIRSILTSGTRNEYILHWYSGPVTFVQVVGEKEVIWHNSYIYEARFEEQAISFDKFSQKLATAFNVDVSSISYTTTMSGNNVVAIYKKGSNRFRLALLGCAADDDLCSWHDSNVEAKVLAAEWEGE